MATLLYRLGIGAYHLLIRLAALFGVRQAKAWVRGRSRNAPFQLPAHLRPRPGAKLLWMHCASLGEFEQGRPVLEAIRQERPDWKVLLTFFSPSGYERCYNDPLADHVTYLPADGRRRAERWIKTLKPDLAIFVKYEFWYFHLRALQRAGVPTFLVAATFRSEQAFFKPWGNWWRRLLRCFTAIVVQTERDRQLLITAADYPENQVTVSGDPRMDRTLQLAATPFSDPILERFSAGQAPIIIAGSVWAEDVAHWRNAWPELVGKCRLVIAPHQLHEAEINTWQKTFRAVRYTRTTAESLPDTSVLLLDTIGMLSRSYRYGDVAYVGGAFRTGLHNTLEPMAYGLPVVFGPKHHKFPEAQTAITRGGARTVTNVHTLIRAVTDYLGPAGRVAAQAQRQLAKEHRGAGKRTAHIVLTKR